MHYPCIVYVLSLLVLLVLALVDFPFYRRQSSDICVYCLVYGLVGVDWRKMYFGHIFLKITHLWGQRFIYSLIQHSVIDSRLESVNMYIILRRIYFFFCGMVKPFEVEVIVVCGLFYIFAASNFETLVRKLSR